MYQVLYHKLGPNLFDIVHEYIGDFLGFPVQEWKSQHHMVVSTNDQLFAYDPKSGECEVKQGHRREWAILPQPFNVTCTGYQTFIQSFEFVDVNGVDWLCASEYPIQANPVLTHRDAVLLHRDGVIYIADLPNKPIVLNNVQSPVSVSRIEDDAFLVAHLRGSAVVYIPRHGMVSIRHSCEENFICTRTPFNVSSEGELYCEFDMDHDERPVLPTNAWMIGFLTYLRTLILFDGTDLIGFSFRTGHLQRHRLPPLHVPVVYNDRVHVYNGQTIKVLL